MQSRFIGTAESRYELLNVHSHYGHGRQKTYANSTWRNFGGNFHGY